MHSAMCPIFAFGARFGQGALHPRAKPRARYRPPLRFRCYSHLPAIAVLRFSFGFWAGKAEDQPKYSFQRLREGKCVRQCVPYSLLVPVLGRVPCTHGQSLVPVTVRPCVLVVTRICLQLLC